MTRPRVLLFAAAAAIAGPLPLEGQEADSVSGEGSSTTVAASDSVEVVERRARRLAKADSIRATLVHPPARPPHSLGERVDGVLGVALVPVRVTVNGLSQLGFMAMDVLSSMNAAGVEPDAGSIGPRSGPAVGLDLVRYEPFYLEGDYSLRDSRTLGGGLAFGDPEARGARIGYRYEFHAQPHFWGIGPDTDPAAESDFLWERNLATVEAGVPLGSGLRVDAEAGFEENRLGPGGDDTAPDVVDVFDAASLFGLADQTRLVRAGGSVTWDRRSWHEFQRRGVLARLGATRWQGVDDTDTEFHRLEAEAHTYLPITDRHALAFRALAEMTRGETRSGIPFTHLASLGSSNGLRGYSGDRFRDRDLAALMSEYRYEIWRDEPSAVEGFLLWDMGGVARSLDELDRIRTSYGFGARVIKSESLLALAYVAFSSEETRVTLKFGWPF